MSEAEFADKFRTLASQWHEETRSSSFIVTDHPAYREILALGPKVIPLIIDDMRHGDRALWFHALATLTGEDHAFGAQTVPEAERRWIEWAETRDPGTAGETVGETTEERDRG